MIYNWQVEKNRPVFLYRHVRRVFDIDMIYKNQSRLLLLLLLYTPRIAKSVSKPRIPPLHIDTKPPQRIIPTKPLMHEPQLLHRRQLTITEFPVILDLLHDLVLEPGSLQLVRELVTAELQREVVRVVGHCPHRLARTCTCACAVLAIHKRVFQDFPRVAILA